MSKFKVVDGGNVTSIATTSREVKQLEMEIQKKIGPTDREYVIYAYHFVRLGNLLLAQKYLNRMHMDYWDTQVYVDLSRALVVWSVTKVDPAQKTDATSAISEYFVILKRVITMFDDVNFTSKPAYFRFRKQFNEFTNVPKI